MAYHPAVTTSSTHKPALPLLPQHIAGYITVATHTFALSYFSQGHDPSQLLFVNALYATQKGPTACNQTYLYDCVPVFFLFQVPY